MENLSKQEFKVMLYIQNCIKENSYCPSMREVSQACEVKSLQTVSAIFENLDKKGFIRRKKGACRAITVLKEVEQNEIV